MSNEYLAVTNQSKIDSFHNENYGIKIQFPLSKQEKKTNIT